MYVQLICMVNRKRPRLYTTVDPNTKKVLKKYGIAAGKVLDDYAKNLMKR